jgi:hypothetical protein
VIVICSMGAILLVHVTAAACGALLMRGCKLEILPKAVQNSITKSRCALINSGITSMFGSTMTRSRRPRTSGIVSTTSSPVSLEASSSPAAAGIANRRQQRQREVRAPVRPLSSPQ